MEFILDNYMWILGGCIVLLMTLIGYIADKSNYIEKQKERDNKSKEKNEVKKKNHLTYGKKAFNKEIGKGDNLVLEESLLTYPVEFDKELEEIVIPNNETEIEPIEDLAKEEIEKEESIKKILPDEYSEQVEIPVEEVPVEEILTPEEITEDKNDEDIWNF